jgi:hypothetical protein
VWLGIEKPNLKENVTKIWSMRDGTTDPNDHSDGDLKAVASEETESRPAMKTLQIFWSEITDDNNGVSHSWSLYVGEANKGVNPCDSQPINNHDEFCKAPGRYGLPTSVSNDMWEINVEGMDCTLFGDRLECPGADTRISITCAADPRPADTCGSEFHKAITHCDW